MRGLGKDGWNVDDYPTERALDDGVDLLASKDKIIAEKDAILTELMAVADSAVSPSEPNSEAEIPGPVKSALVEPVARMQAPPSSEQHPHDGGNAL
jgi:hypothetical protein